MLRLNRTTEYGLMALRHMSCKLGSGSQEITSAREIADSYGLPFEITAKTLQRLKDTGLIDSAHGAKGGYRLLRSLGEISLAEFLELMEGPQTLVACTAAPLAVVGPGVCEYGSRCEIHDFMSHVNTRVFDFLSGIQLSELTDEMKPLVVLGDARLAESASQRKES